MSSQQCEGAGYGIVEPIDCRLRVEQHNASAQVKHQREHPIAASAKEEHEMENLVTWATAGWHLQLLWRTQLQQQAERDHHHDAAELRWIGQMDAVSAKERVEKWLNNKE